MSKIIPKVINVLIIIALGFQALIYYYNTKPSGKVFTQKSISVENFSSIVLSKSGITKNQMMMLDILANNDWERLEGNSGTHKFVNVEAVNITGTGTVSGDDVSATDQLQAARVNVTGSTAPSNGLYLPAVGLPELEVVLKYKLLSVVV